MKRNTSLIGIARTTTAVAATGLFDLFDQYNRRLTNIWPAVPVYISITPNTGSYNEGSTITFVITTDNVVNGTTLYYTIETVGGSISTSDFTDFATSGSFTINSNTGSFSKTLTFDGTSESGDSFLVRIRTDSTAGTIVLSTGTITINNPTFSISPNTTSVNEGSSVTFTVSTTNVNNITMYYSVSAVSGSISGSDFTSGSTTGSFFLSGNAGSFTLTMSNDVTTEGTEQFLVYLRIDSTVGTIVATSSTITINDTSQTPSASVNLGTTSINEGSTMSVSVSTTNFSNGTLYWSLEATSGLLTGTDFSATSGSFSVSSSSGSFNFVVSADAKTEGSESFIVRVRLNSTSGTIIGTSATFTVNDTSTGGQELSGGAGFSLYIPSAADGYILSQYPDLTNLLTGSASRILGSTWIRALVNGQGRGVLGTGGSGISSSQFQLMTESTGSGNFVYADFNDCFQPGTPHEMGAFVINNTYYLGGFNDSAPSFTAANGSVRSWIKADGTVVVLLGSTTAGHAVFQYRIDSSQPKILKMSMSYTNTTSSSVTLAAQRGGDCDLDGYTTNNYRNSSELAYSMGANGTRGLGVYCPGNGYTHNAGVSSAFTQFNPTAIINGSGLTSTVNGDTSIYCAWDIGTVAAGSTVVINCFYIFDTSSSGIISQSGSITV